MQTLIAASEGHAFDDTATQAMGQAYEFACGARPDTNREVIALRIVALAKSGMHDPVQLYTQVINELPPRP